MDRHDQKANIASVEVTKGPFDSFGLAIFIVVLIEVLFLIGVNLYQKNRAEALDQKLSEYKQQLASEQYSTLNTQLEEVLDGNEILQSVLASKLRWSKFYTMFNAVTPKNVRVVSLSISNTGSFRAEGETSSLSSLAQTLVAWRNGTQSAPSPFTALNLASNSFANIDGKRVVTFSVSGTIDTGKMR